MNAAKNIVPITRIVARQFHKSNVVRATEEQMYLKRQKLKQLQERFQIPDGVPVHLKGGIMDRIVYGSTLLLMVIGLGMSADTLYALYKK